MNVVSRRSLLALVMLVALADGVFAQASRLRSQRIDPLTSSIRGRVTTADTGSPVRGAEVRLSIDGGIRRLVTTNGEGRFEIRNLPAGEYRLSVSKTGFITLEYGQQRPFETAATITLGEGQSATGNVALLRGGAIVGRVLDEFGDPSVGTRMQVMRLRAEGGSRRLLPVGAGDQTDERDDDSEYDAPENRHHDSHDNEDAADCDPADFAISHANVLPVDVGATVQPRRNYPRRPARQPRRRDRQPHQERRRRDEPAPDPARELLVPVGRVLILDHRGEMLNSGRRHRCSRKPRCSVHTYHPQRVFVGAEREFVTELGRHTGTSCGTRSQSS